VPESRVLNQLHKSATQRLLNSSKVFGSQIQKIPLDANTGQQGTPAYLARKTISADGILF
jgi:hypothetical protein